MTPAQANKACAWALRQLGLQDWSVRLALCDEQPSFAPQDDYTSLYGLNILNCREKVADIWVRPGMHKTTSAIVDTICHEVLHIALHEAGLSNDKQGDEAEFFIGRVAAVMAKARR